MGGIRERGGCRLGGVAVPSEGVNNDAQLIAAAVANGHVLTDDMARAVMGRHAWERRQGAGLWIQIVPGRYRHAATPPSFDMNVTAGAAWLGRRGALFGATALHWLGVDVDEPRHVDFLVPRIRRSIPNWMTLHTTTRWDNRDIIRHNGLRTSTATRAIIDMATQPVKVRDLERAIDSAVQMRRTAIPRLRARLAGLGGTGRTGCRLLRELLLDSGGESYLERRFLALVRTAGLPRPECQVVFKRGDVVVARVDFRFPGSVVVEVSGRLGHVSDTDRQRDARRRNHLQISGLIVLEFTTVDVIDDPLYVLTTLRQHLRVAA